MFANRPRRGSGEGDQPWGGAAGPPMMPEHRNTPSSASRRGPGGQGDDHVGHDVGQHQMALPGQLGHQSPVGEHIPARTV